MKLLIAGGGTGGHLFPGLAVAEELASRGHEVCFVGTARGIEAKKVPEAGFPLELIEVAGLKRRRLGDTIAGLARLPRGLWQSWTLLRRQRPDVVVGVGGYASGPVVLCAALAGRPTAILEQNSVPGFTNRTLGRFVDLVFGAFATARDAFPAHKYRLVGNPVRRRVRDALTGVAGEGEALLVIGGSQGAHAVNELVFGAMERLRSEGLAPPLLHQTGLTDAAPLARRYAEAGIAAEVHPFIEDMGAAYRRAKLVVARAGASTLAELMLVGKPALLVPFPFAADDHQTVNARELSAAGAAELLPQETTTAAQLAEAVRRLFTDEARRARMADEARALSHPRAHLDIADALEALGRPSNAVE